MVIAYLDRRIVAPARQSPARNSSSRSREAGCDGIVYGDRVAIV